MKITYAQLCGAVNNAIQKAVKFLFPNSNLW